MLVLIAKDAPGSGLPARVARERRAAFDAPHRGAHRAAMDRRAYDDLELAIRALQPRPFFADAPVQRAIEEARAALVAFQREPLTAPLRQASNELGHRLQDIQIHQPALNWEALLRAWEALEREVEPEAWG